MTFVLERIAKLTTFRSLHHRNYRLFFTGQIFSLTGTWMQSMAQSWFVYQLTYSSVWLGVIGFLNSIPILFFSMFGGSLADRMSKHRLIIITQVLSLIQALFLGTLVLFDIVTVEMVAILAFILGTINAFDIPARQSFIVELVGKQDLTNAIALNSAMFNAARIIGPAIGGIVIAAVGVGWCFLLNAVSFFAVLAGLMKIELKAQVKQSVSSANVLHSLHESIAYIRSDVSLTALLILVAVVTIFGWSYAVLLPVFADSILNIGAVGLGNLLTAVGTGAFISAIILASVESKVNPRSFTYVGIFLFVIAISIFSVSSNILLSLVSLVGVGMGLVLFLATANATIQRRVPDQLRGRVMGLYSLIFQGLSPFGSLGIGALASGVGARAAVLCGAAVCGISGITVRFMMNKIRSKNRSK